MNANARYCRDCGIELIVDDNWYPSCVKRRDYICKACISVRDRRRYQERRKEILAYQSIYYQEHAEYIKARTKRWYQAKRDAILERNRHYYQEHKAEFLERSRRYRENNREADRARKRRWARNNPSKIREAQRRRLARKAGSTIHLLDERFIYERDRLACVYCNSPCDLTLDHVVPLSRGGEHKYDNLAAACRSCNSSKGTKEVFGWLAIRRAA